MLGPNELPWAVTGERCAILEKPAKERTAGGLYVPDTAKERYYNGKLIDAGLKARDKLYDNGYELGDEVEFGRYSGLREAWDHVVSGDHALPEDAYDWKFDREGSNPSMNRYTCSRTGAVRQIESIIVLNVDDLLASIQLAERIRNGQMAVKRGVTPEGQTMHYIERTA